MKKLANLLVVLGAIVAVISFTMDVTVGDSGIVNMNLMAQRQNLLIVGYVAFLAGIVLLVGGQRQAESKEGQRPEMEIIRPQSEIKTGPSIIQKHLLKGAPPTEFFGRVIGSTFAAIVGALVVNKIMDSMGYIDSIANAVHMDVWMHPEMFYLPTAILIFLASMKKGLPVIVGMFYLELAACLVWSVILIAFFDAQWAVFGFFSSEIFFSIAGVAVATRFRPKAESAIP
jgi:hypothetical protein